MTRNQRSSARRTRLRKDGLCINGISHGPATHGVLCAACRVTHCDPPRPVPLLAPAPALGDGAAVSVAATEEEKVSTKKGTAARTARLIYAHYYSRVGDFLEQYGEYLAGKRETAPPLPQPRRTKR